MKSLVQGSGDSRRDEEDDVASVNSDRSALSFSSEVSINPYTKFSNPVQVSLFYNSGVAAPGNCNGLPPNTFCNLRRHL